MQNNAVCQLFSPKGALIVQTGNGDIDGMIVREKTLSPTNMRLVIGVPRSHVLKTMHGVLLLTLAV